VADAALSPLMLSLLVLQRRVDDDRIDGKWRKPAREEEVVVNAATALLESNEVAIMHKIGAAVR